MVVQRRRNVKLMKCYIISTGGPGNLERGSFYFPQAFGNVHNSTKINAPAENIRHADDTARFHGPLNETVQSIAVDCMAIWLQQNNKSRTNFTVVKYKAEKD